jgi:hypothetical protein
MAINIDHTNSAIITLRGPSNASVNDTINFVFPNTQSSSASLLLSGEADISAISGLVSALGQKVEKSVTGSAATRNYGTAAGEVPILDADGKLEGVLIPSIAIRDTYQVGTLADATSLSNACIGDLAIATGDQKNYILCSAAASGYQTQSNWKEIKFQEQTVCCVNNLDGAVTLDGSNVYLSAGSANYNGQSIDAAVEDLYVDKADKSCLNLYATTGYVTDCLALYPTCTVVDQCLANYETCCNFSTTLTNYIYSCDVTTCLTGYVLRTETGSAAALDIGTSAGNVVVVQGDGKICYSVLPTLAITDTFLIDASGDLLGLTSAEQGDIAIVTGAVKANYILRGDTYSQAEDWAQLATTFGAITGVNGLTAVDGNVNVGVADIDVASTSTIYDGGTLLAALTGLDARITATEGDYLTESEASALLADYVLTGTATGIFNTKSDNGHGHAISDVTGLGSCLNAITTFYTGAGAYAATQNASNPLMNEAIGDYSVALGYGAKAVQDYEVAQAAGWFSTVGDAQVSKIPAKASTTSTSLEVVASVEMEASSNIMFSATIIGRGASSNYAAFKVEGAAQKSAGGTVSILNATSVNTFEDNAGAYTANAYVYGSTGIAFKVEGDAGMKWVSDVNVVKVKI